MFIIDPLMTALILGVPESLSLCGNTDEKLITCTAGRKSWYNSGPIQTAGAESLQCCFWKFTRADGRGWCCKARSAIRFHAILIAWVWWSDVNMFGHFWRMPACAVAHFSPADWQSRACRQREALDCNLPRAFLLTQKRWHNGRQFSILSWWKSSTLLQRWVRPLTGMRWMCNT